MTLKPQQGVVCSQATKMAVIPMMNKAGVVLAEERQRDEDQYIELLHRALSTHTFYFSYNYGKDP
jgi:hypothetical protein